MVIRGATRGNGRQLASYLTTMAENERIEVFDIRGTTQAHSLRDSLLEMDLTAELTKSDKGLYHAQICPAYGEDKAMKKEDWLKAAAILEDELKLTGQKRVIVLHEKQGRIHAHVVWERYDHEKGKMISDSYSRLAQDRARKTMEKVLVQQKTPDRNKHRDQMKRDLTALWQRCKTGAEFIKAAKEIGYTVAWSRGRRPFMVVDRQGRSFDLVRQLDKVKTAEVRDKLKGSRIPTDKRAIKDIRAQGKDKSFTRAGEDMADSIERHRLKREAAEEKEELFQSKRREMKQEGPGMTQDAGDKDMNQSQEKMRGQQQSFKEQEERKEQERAKAEKRDKEQAQAQDQKQETEKERRYREVLAEMQRNMNQNQEKENDLDFDLSL